MAALVRVNKTAVGIVFPAVFSLLRTRRMAFTASVASSRLPCVGTDEISPADRVADHQGRGSLEIDDDEGGLEGGPVDLIQDRIFRHVSDDGQTRPT